MNVDIALTLKIVEILAVVAAALSGIIEARRKNMDIIGVYFVALVTAFGGGTVRDVLLNRSPLFWIEHGNYPLIILGLSLMAVIFFRHGIQEGRWLFWTMNILDALGLGLFATVGAEYAFHSRCNFFICTLMGVITGVFGGVIRDVLCNEIPSVFRRNTQLYATCAFVGANIYLLTFFATFNHGMAIIPGMLSTFFLRMLALKYNLKLP